MLLSTFLKPVAKPKGEERAPVVSRNQRSNSYISGAIDIRLAFALRSLSERPG